MKRIIVLVLIFTLAAALFACGGSTKLTASDLALQIGGFTATPETTMDDVRAALGEADEYAEAVSCVYTGMDKTFTYDNMIVYTYPDGETDRLMEIYCDGGDAVTAKGITFGASVEEIEAAYGSGYTKSGTLLTYELPVSAENMEPASLYFELENDRVTAIGITAEHRAE